MGIARSLKRAMSMSQPMKMLQLVRMCGVVCVAFVYCLNFVFCISCEAVSAAALEEKVVDSVIGALHAHSSASALQSVAEPSVRQDDETLRKWFANFSSSMDTLRFVSTCSSVDLSWPATMAWRF